MKTQKEQTGLKRNHWILLVLLIIINGIISTNKVCAQDTTYLSDLPFLSAWSYPGIPEGTAYKGWEEYILRDAINTTGDPIVLNGVTYTKGLSARAPSEIFFDLRQNYTTFLTDIGLRSCAGYGNVFFKVYCDGNPVYNSSLYTAADPTISLEIDVTGVSELRLVVDSTNDGSTCDLSVWANARLIPGIALTPAFPDTIKMLHNGNSLSPTWLLNGISGHAKSSGFIQTWGTNTEYADDLKSRWEQGTDEIYPRGKIMSGKYTHYQIQPNSGEYGRYFDWQDDTLRKYTQLFYDLAKDYDMKPYLYCYWFIKDWPRSEQDKIDSVFINVADSIGSDLTIIPCGRAVANVWEACAQGIIADWDTNAYINTGQGSHPTYFGHYINSLTHFATIYQQSPEGLPTFEQVDNSTYTVSDSNILKIQKIVWNTVKTFPNTNIDTIILPTALLASDKTVTAINAKVTFDASGSIAVSGETISRYRWTFGDKITPIGRTDNGESDHTENPGRNYPNYETSSPVIAHTYTDPGKYVVRLVVVQDNGKTSSDYIIITVEEEVDTEAPSVPTNLTSSNITENSFTLSWDESTDNIGVTAYEIFRNNTSIGISASASFNVTGLSANTSYSMTVIARDGSGNESAASTALNVTTAAPDTESPTIPTGLSSSGITETSFTLSWTASTDNVGVTEYEVFRDGVSEGTSASNTMDITGLTCEAMYAMTVRASDAAGNWSDQSTALNVTTSTCSGDTEAPSIPTGLTSSDITETSFTLSWTASTDNIGVTTYEVLRDGISVGTTASTTIDITGLSCETSYEMTVRARDAAGNWSAQSTALDITTLTCPDTEAPTAPTDLNFSAITETSFTLSWTASTDNVGVTEYEVFRDGISAGTTSSTTFDLSGLTASTVYAMTVNAKDAAGNISATSVALNVTTSTAITIGENECSINVYPNPANSFVIIELDSKKPVTIQLLNITGNLIEMRNNVSGSIKLNIENYSRGIYLIKLISVDNTRIVKLMKN